MRSRGGHVSSPQDLRRRIARLPMRQPITEAYEAKLMRRGLRSAYPSQQHHWVAWLGAYDGPGFYGRQRWDRSARFVFNHVQCPAMLLWLGEATKLQANIIRLAAQMDLKSQLALPTRCSEIRRLVAWAEVERRLLDLS